ncbi:hypothetical protein HGRIS_011989 [Hohenbuehelia grisea]|uniref:CBM1 domain-containing protein n=1 Tax=Hohenbuehelia grisea TaxID=104357 RepID=A0ABR3JWR0_9AGAR
MYCRRMILAALDIQPYRSRKTLAQVQTDSDFISEPIFRAQARQSSRSAGRMVGLQDLLGELLEQRGSVFLAQDTTIMKMPMNFVVLGLFIALDGSAASTTTRTTTTGLPTTQASSTSDAGTTTCWTSEYPSLTATPTLTSSRTANPTSSCWTTYLTLTTTAPTPPPKVVVPTGGTCGGIGNGFPAGAACQAGSVCIHHDNYSATCVPINSLPAPIPRPPPQTPPGVSYIQPWGTCGGYGNNVPAGAVCINSYCVHHNDYDATCVPFSSLPSSTPSSTPSPSPSPSPPVVTRVICA